MPLNSFPEDLSSDSKEEVGKPVSLKNNSSKPVKNDVSGTTEAAIRSIQEDLAESSV